MSYIKKIEDDYNKGLITLVEISKLREQYKKATKEEKEVMDKPYQTEAEEVDVEDNESTNMVEGDIQSQLNSIKNTVESNHTILMVFVVLSIISVLFAIKAVASIS